MPTVQAGDIRLHYVEYGSGRPLLLIHGFPLDHSMWSEQWEQLSRSCRVVVPDLRGFGESEVTSGTVTMQQYADDLAALLDALSIREPVVLAGLSMGGYIAWQFWQRHAARLAGLVLCDTRAVADTPEAAAQRLKTAEQVLASGSHELVEAMLGKLFAAETVKSQPDIVERTRQVMQSTAPAGIAAALRGMAQRPDVSAKLPQVQLPCLVVCGEQDVISTAGEMRGMAEAMPQARFVLIPRAGHMSPLERPEEVNTALEHWLQSL